MNKTKRFSLGFISSLLLAVGFVRAAECLDPISNGISHSAYGGISAPNTVSASYFAEES